MSPHEIAVHVGAAALRVSVPLLLLLTFVQGASRTSAATRHWVCFLFLLGALVMPLAPAILPGWTLPVVPSPAGGGGAAASSGIPLAAQVLSWLWLGGACLLLARWLLGIVGTARLQRRASPLRDPAWHELTARARRDLGLRQTVCLMTGAQTRIPVTWGVLRPTVLLPAEAARWPRPRRYAVLLHELMHVRRRDCLTQRVADLACAVYWFHPLIWLAARSMRRERENACDDGVLRRGARPASYAGLLLENVCPAGLLPAPALALGAGGRLEGRIRALLDRRRDRRSITTADRWTMGVLVLAVVLPFAWVGFAAVPRAEAGPAVVPTPLPVRSGPPVARAPAAARAATAVAEPPAPAAAPKVCAPVRPVAVPPRPPRRAVGFRIQAELSVTLPFRGVRVSVLEAGTAEVTTSGRTPGGRRP
ncbi:MAG: M56 family metallopeptidase [Planctomycetota bacterium]